LALFGRRPPERAVSSVLPASENLHKSGREQMQQRGAKSHSMTSSAETASSEFGPKGGLSILRILTLQGGVNLAHDGKLVIERSRPEAAISPILVEGRPAFVGSWSESRVRS
jgi:hypothetical protein